MPIINWHLHAERSMKWRAVTCKIRAESSCDVLRFSPLLIWDSCFAMPRALREPREFERHLFHEVYIDETSRNDHRFLALGGIIIPRELSAEFEADIRFVV